MACTFTKCKAIAMWLFAHPIGQLVMLLLITIPLGIFSIVKAQDSYDKMNGAVGQFSDILDSWAVKPLTALEVKASGGTCSSGFENFAPISWPQLSGVPCACPGYNNQPFNQASSGELDSAVSSIYGYGRRRRGAPSSTYNNKDNALWVGAWVTSYCYTTKNEYDNDYTDPQTSGRRRRMSNGGSGGSYYGSTYRGSPACTSDGTTGGSDLSFGGSCSASVDGGGASGSVSCSYSSCFVEDRDDVNGTTYYSYRTYSTQCGLLSKQSSGSGDCSSDQSRMRCTADATTTSFSMGEWRDKVICSKRDGTEAVSESGDVRPDADSAGCPDGYSRCGSGDYNTNMATCTASGTACPLTNIQVYDSTSSSYNATEWSSVFQLDGNYVLVSRNASTTSTAELPVTSTALDFSAPRCVDSDGNRELEDYGVSGDSSRVSWPVTYKYDTCEQDDTRWTQMDQTTSSAFLQDNFDTQCGSSSGNVINWNVLSTVTVSNIGYHIFGVAANAMDADSGTYCESNDDICGTVMSRTLCGKLTAWANSAGNGGIVASPTWMAEIFFKVDTKCATKEDLYDSKSTLNTCKDAVLTLLILMYIAFISCVILAVVCIVFDFQGQDDDSESDDFKQTTTHRVKSGCAICMGVGSLVAMIIALVAAVHLGDIYSDAEECTDKISAEYGGFSTLNHTLHDVESNTVINIVICAILLAFDIYGIITATAFSADMGDLDSPGDDDEPSVKLEQPPSATVQYCEHGRIRSKCQYCEYNGSAGMGTADTIIMETDPPSAPPPVYPSANPQNPYGQA